MRRDRDVPRAAAPLGATCRAYEVTLEVDRCRVAERDQRVCIDRPWRLFGPRSDGDLQPTVGAGASRDRELAEARIAAREIGDLDAPGADRLEWEMLGVHVQVQPA